MHALRALRAAVGILAVHGLAVSQDPEPTPTELKREIDELRQELHELRHGEDDDHAHPPDHPDHAHDRDDGHAHAADEDYGLANPAITIAADFVGSVSTDGKNNALNRFSMREVEVEARAPIGSWVDGVLVIAIAEEIEPMPGGDVDITTEFELEEAYADFHTLPGNLSVEAGKFRNHFGVNNLLHTHAIPQVTRPLANQAFFGREGISTPGVAVTWRPPIGESGELALTAEVINADGGAEAPIFGGPNAENPAALAHADILFDLGEHSSLELGGSYLFTRTADGADFEGHVFGVDATWTWDCPDSEGADLQVVGELFFADNDIQDPMGNRQNESLGGYAYAQYQFQPSWHVGVRGDYTEFPDSETRGTYDKDWAFSPYLTWYPLEFLRLRGEYQHLNAEVNGLDDDEDNFFFNVTFIFGAHTPHRH